MRAGTRAVPVRWTGGSVAVAAARRRGRRAGHGGRGAGRAAAARGRSSALRPRRFVRLCAHSTAKPRRTNKRGAILYWNSSCRDKATRVARRAGRPIGRRTDKSSGDSSNAVWGETFGVSFLLHSTISGPGLTGCMTCNASWLDVLVPTLITSADTGPNS